MANRADLPDWPRWMPIDLAAAYLGVSPNTFRCWGITPIERGRRVLFDRRHLDAFADRESGQPSNDAERKRASKDVEEAFLARRRGG